MSDVPPVNRALRLEWRFVLAWGLACLAAHAGLAAAASLLPAGLGDKAALLLPKVDKWLPTFGFLLLFAVRGWGTDRSEGRHLSPLLLAGLVCLAWTHRFVQDDAYITFRYARNLASGFGLVWNPGEPPLEGYTNFLWAVLLALAIGTGIDPALASMVMGILCLVATCLFTHRTALLLSDNARVANLAVFVAGTNYTFSAYATGGLETQLQTALLTGFILTCLRITRNGDCRTRDALSLSFLALFAVLTRLDSGLILGVAVLFVLVHLHRAGVGLPGLLRRHALAVLPATLLLLLYFVWKISFYGHLLPNTFHVKAQGGGHLGQGLLYVHTFLSAYGYTLPLVMVIVSGAWMAYVAKVGGCFMEFRFMVPVTPWLAVLMTTMIHRHMGLRILHLVCLGWLGMSAVHRSTFTGLEVIDSVSSLRSTTTDTFGTIGHRMRDLFAGEDILVGVGAAGVIPYLSDLPSVDLWGLNDAWIARNGITRSRKPGHGRYATAAYVVERKVNLVLSCLVHARPEGPPRPATIPELTAFVSRVSEENIPRNACVLEIPVDETRSFSALYLTPHPAVERHIDSGLFRVRNILRAAPGDPDETNTTNVGKQEQHD